MNYSVREISNNDAPLVVSYFLDAETWFLHKMGVDISKLPERDDWIEKIKSQIDKPIIKKKFYYIIWLIDGEPVGHSNINHIRFGESAKFHLHLWRTENRTKGLGKIFLLKTLPFYFGKYNLKQLIGEPYALNPSPNKLLENIGFELEKTYDTVPGWINFKQPVNRWVLTKERYEQLS